MPPSGGNLRNLLRIVLLVGGLACVVPARSEPGTLVSPPAALGSPITFLLSLKTGPVPRAEPSVMTFRDPVKGWIKREHIPALIALLDSTELCTAVVDARSSFLPDSSTVGDEAAMLIDGYRDGYYPSRLHASRYTYADKQAMRAWWRAASKT